MLALIIILLLLGIVFGILGFVIKGLVWLAIIGIVLFLASIVWGAIRGRGSRA